MLQQIIHAVIFGLLRLFYPRIEVQGQDYIPPTGPVIFVANHPNGLLDPMVLTASTGRPVRFLAASYLFRIPVIGLCMRAFDALPVYRDTDQDIADKPLKDVVARNDAIFADCRSWLAKRGALALFPEGTTHSGSKLLRLRSGVARIGLGAEVDGDWNIGVQIVPVGLWYQNKSTFRSSVLVVFGEPLTLADYQAAYTAKPAQTLRTVTAQITRSLGTVVLQAESRELLEAAPILAAWTRPAGPPATLAERRAATQTLLAAYEKLSVIDPGRVDMLTTQARRYARTLRLFGIDDPWALEVPLPQYQSLARRAVKLLMSAPFASAGFIFSYIPYRLSRPIARRLAHNDETQMGHYKLIVGACLLPFGWLIWSGIAGWIWGIPHALLLFCAQPFLGYAALRWGEYWHEFRTMLKYVRFRHQHDSITREMIERRHALAKEIVAAIESVQADDDHEIPQTPLADSKRQDVGETGYSTTRGVSLPAHHLKT